MIFLKTILIQLPCNPFKYIFVHMRHSKSCRLCDAKISFAMI